MNWHRKCRLCLTDSPYRPVHALRTPELYRMMKDLCRIEIDKHDNMDLICSLCVQVITKLKFFISNQKVIAEVREFNQRMLAIKEENEADDCIIIDQEDGKNDQQENCAKGKKQELLSHANKTAMTELKNRSKLKPLLKRKLSNDLSKKSNVLAINNEKNLKNKNVTETSFRSESIKKCKIMIKKVLSPSRPKTYDKQDCAIRSSKHQKPLKNLDDTNINFKSSTKPLEKIGHLNSKLIPKSCIARNITTNKRTEAESKPDVEFAGNTNQPPEVNIRVVRVADKVSIKIQKYGHNVRYSDLNAKQLEHIKKLLWHHFTNNKTMQGLLLVCPPDEEAKKLLDALKIGY